MSLLKLPIIAVLAYEFHAMLTPPHAPPAKEEVVASISIDPLWVRKYRLAFARTGNIVLSTAESVAIIALAFPSLPKVVANLDLQGGGSPHLFSLNAVSLLGAALLIAGARLRMWTFRELGKYFRFDISIQKDHNLITTGPYSFVRHPSYTGLILATLGWFIFTFAPGSLIRECGLLSSYSGSFLLAIYIVFGLLPSLFVTLGRMSKEDEALRERFGAQWEKWYQRVPYSVLPGIY